MGKSVPNLPTSGQPTAGSQSPPSGRKKAQAAPPYQGGQPPGGGGKNSAAPPPLGAGTPPAGGAPAAPQQDMSTKAYRDYLQQPPSGSGARMSYNQFVESRGGPSPGQGVYPVQPSMGAGGGGQQSQAPISPEGFNAYNRLLAGTGKNRSAAARQFVQQYGGGYDPKGTLARSNALRKY